MNSRPLAPCAGDSPYQEVGLDHPREWLELTDPDDPSHLIRADLTWLLASWQCLFGHGCHGILANRETEGCCSHGAFFTDTADEKRVRRAVQRLNRHKWQYFRRGFANYTELDSVGDESPTRRTATVPDGPCVFLNAPDFPAGGGCALHAQALRDGVSPMTYKPDVCWQLPIRREQSWLKRPDGSEVLVSTIGEFDRRGWGEGGHDLHWWCTSSPEAHRAPRPLYQAYEAELVALLGKPGYLLLAEMCGKRERQGMVAPHPAGSGKLPA